MSRVGKWSALGVLTLAAGAAASTLLLSGGNGFPAIGSGAGAVAGTAGNNAVDSRLGGKLPPSRGDANALGRSASIGNGVHIVVFREAALGAYDGEIRGMPAPERRMGASGKARIDSQGAEARRYVSYLRDRQGRHEAAMANRIGRTLNVRDRMQHAINAVVTELSPAEVNEIRKLPEVLFVEEYREYPLDTDVGPRHIGAQPVWEGTNPGAPARYQGEGTVVGVIDSGINFGSPSFSAVDPIDGYQHVNPLGAGTYLGTCAPGGVDEGRCNDKLIGGYNFVCNYTGPEGSAALCGTANVREEPGFGDTNGHGTHTAGTAAGNRRDVNFSGALVRISGVAPRANVIAYDACYTNTATGQGLCPNVSTLASVNQAVRDGIVDVINYSIGGGTAPWSDAISLAFLNAVDSGIYVAASAGNSGPGPNTMGHLQPWVSSTAAAQHGRGSFAFMLNVTGPQPVPSALSPVVLTPGGSGVAFSAAVPGTTALRVSSTIDAADDGCAAYPANSFAGAIAVVRRGTCAFADKVNNASGAGAIAVIIANNQAGALIPSVPGTTVPAFSVTQAEGNALRDFAQGKDNVTAGIGFPALPVPNVADALASFSSRGPAGTLDLAKPDVTAPGVNILAAYAGDTISGYEQLVSAISGTSMASPHQAGAAALVRQARAAWTVPEIKSALAMTAEQVVLLEDQVTPANAFAGGSGRIRVDRAINAGLVLNETAANYWAANPAAGGDVSALNQPSMAKRGCVNCSFTRTFRSTLGTSRAWTARLTGVPGTVSPSSFTVAPGGSVTVTVTINSANIPADGSWNFGQLTLQPAGGASQNAAPNLHLPVVVSVPPPTIKLPDFAQLTLGANRLGTINSSVQNIGGGMLEWAVSGAASAPLSPVNQPRGGVGTGLNSGFLTNNAIRWYIADDFVLSSETRLNTIFTEGFRATSGRVDVVNDQLTWFIFPDANGQPAGNPETAAGAAAWSYRATSTTGITNSGTGQINNFSLNLAAAGQNVVLPAGRYWLVMSTRTTIANRWLWFATNDGTGGYQEISFGTGGTGQWEAWDDWSGTSFRIDGTVSCGAPWIGAVTPSRGSNAAMVSRAVRVSVNSRGLAPGTYGGNLCIASNDPAKPVAPAPLRLVVSP